MIDPEIRRMTEAILSKHRLDKIPASLSRKWHLGEGLTNHLLRTVWFSEHLACECDLEPIERDMLISASLLHDVGNALIATKKRKPDAYQRFYPTGYNRSEVGYQNHPMISQFMVGEYILLNGKEDNPHLTKIAKMCASHMEHWHQDTCPMPSDLLEELLCIADYFASRKGLTIDELVVKNS